MIQFYNTFIAIKNYKKNSQLENGLTVRDKVTMQPKWYAFDYQPKKNILIIPKGYSKEYMSKLFPDKAIYYMDRDPTRSINIKADKYEPRNDIQIRTLEWLFENQRFSKKLIDATMDSGKTYIALKYICECKKIALIMVHNDSILNQWIKEIVKFTDIQLDEIGVIKGVKSIEECQNNLKYKIFLASERTLSNLLELDKLRIFKFCKEVGIGIKIVDEAHLFLKTICEVDLHSDVNDNIYLTGTAKRSDWKENKILSRILPINYSFISMNSEYSNTERRITALFVDYDSKTTTNEDLSLHNRYGFQQAMWAAHSINYIDLLVQIFYDHYMNIEYTIGKDKNLQHAIFLKTLEQCSIFYSELKKMIPNVFIGMFNSNVDKNEKKKALSAKIIITTEKSFGVAIDSTINIIHNYIPMASEAPISQMIGRLRKGSDDNVSMFINYSDQSITGCLRSKSIIKGICKKIALKLYERIYSHERLEQQWKSKIG